MVTMKNACILSILLLSILPSGCQNLMAESPKKAVLNDSSSATVEEVHSIIKDALNQRVSNLSKTIFSKSHRVLIKRKKAIGPDGRPIQTRVDEPPIIFELYKLGEECFILDVRNQKRYTLSKANCSEVESK